VLTATTATTTTSLHSRTDVSAPRRTLGETVSVEVCESAHTNHKNGMKK